MNCSLKISVTITTFLVVIVFFMVVLKYPLNLQYNGYSEAFIFGQEGSHLWLASICTDQHGSIRPILDRVWSFHFLLTNPQNMALI